MSGTALGIVVSTGDATVFGQIAKLTGQPKKGMTTMEKDILRFVMLIFAIMVTWIVIVASVWYVSPQLKKVDKQSRDINLMLQGRLAPQGTSGLDQRVRPHRQLRERRHRLHPRGPPNRRNL